MFSAVLGLFSQDLAVDLGTSRTRIYQRGEGVITDQPTAVAIRTDRLGRREVLAIGEEAAPMRGRTPAEVEVVLPVRAGKIADWDVSEALLLHLMRLAHGRSSLMSPKVVMATPWAASAMEQRAVREACEAAGAREVRLVPRPLAAAMGAGLPVDTGTAHLVVDLGGGGTEIAIIAHSSVVTCTPVPGGGEGLDATVARYLREAHHLLVGPAEAERLKRRLGGAVDMGEARTDVARGRDADRGLPRAVPLHAAEIRRAIAPGVEAITRSVRRTLESAPPQLSHDVMDHGIVLTGDAAHLRHLDLAIREATGLPVFRAEEPSQAVIRGAGEILEEWSLLRKLAS